MPSTAIRRYSYRPSQATLDLAFMSRRVYRYAQAPEKVAGGLARAREKGGCFNRVIRDRFVYAELNGREEPREAAQFSPACDRG
jgi:hypothetical protein